MDFLKDSQSLLYLISLFLMMVFILPFVFREMKKKKDAKRLINRIIPVSSLTDHDLARIKTDHPESGIRGQARKSARGGVYPVSRNRPSTAWCIRRVAFCKKLRKKSW